MNNRKNIIFKIAFVVIIFIITILVISSIVYLSKPQARLTFAIAEIEDGIYAYYENTVSAIPAQNYSMITFSDTQGNIYTVKGKITIRACKEDPFVVWTMYNIVSSDEVTIYIPSNGVKYLGTISVGRR